MSTASAIPPAWCDHLLPRSGWFRVNAKGLPEPRLLETVRLHLLPEEALLRFLRRLSASLKSGDHLTCEDGDDPADLIDCLESLCERRRAQYGLSSAEVGSTHSSAVHAKEAFRSATLDNQQAASIVVSGELHCLAQLETHLRACTPSAITQQALSFWQKA